jgi:signal transduction histidine kinase
VSIFTELYDRREQAKLEAAERIRLEAERAAAEQSSREKDQFLAVLSHELRTPLTSILLWSEMLLTKTLPAEMVRRGLETVDLCARREARMVENVIEMSRLATGTLSLDLTAVDVNDVITEAVADVAGLAAERQVRIVAPPEPAVKDGALGALGDRWRLRQVLYNLLENAVNFTPAGGRVTIVAEDGPSEIAIRVEDTGIGFPPELTPKLFARFKQGNASSTRLRSGLGLGLALAKALIELQGGAITAESQGPGLGASFTVTLPRLRPGADQGAGQSADDDCSLSSPGELPRTSAPT